MHQIKNKYQANKLLGTETNRDKDYAAGMKLESAIDVKRKLKIEIETKDIRFDNLITEIEKI